MTLLLQFVLAVATSAAEAPPSAPPASAETTNQAAKNIKFDRAREAYEAGEFATAVEIFEELWSRHRNENYLFNAAISRLALDHYAHAIAYLEQYERLPRLQPAERLEASKLLEAARRAATEVTLVVENPEDYRGPLELKLTHTNPRRTPINAILADNQPRRQKIEHLLFLDPGEWRIEITNATTRAKTIRIEVDERSPNVHTTELDPLSTRALTFRSDVATDTLRRKTIYGIGGTGVALLGAGIGLGVWGGQELRSLKKDTSNTDLEDQSSIDNFTADVATASLQRDAGLGLIGAGIGAMAGAATGLLPQPRTRTIAYTCEVAAGGIMIAVGLGGIVALEKNNFSVVYFDQGPEASPEEVGKNHENALEEFETKTFESLDNKAATSIILGLGAGLSFSAALHLIIPRLAAKSNRRERLAKRSTATLSPLTGPRLAGLSLRGSF